MFENTLNIGNGIYTLPEVAKILRLPYYKVSRWLNKYWDQGFGQQFRMKYSWSVRNTKAIGFYTLIEFYIFYQLGRAGVKTSELLKAHKELSEIYKTPYPFAKKEILESLRTDGKKIYIPENESWLALNGTQQLNLSFIQTFFKNLDFDNDLMASRFWPLGKSKNIVIDPGRQMGHPVVGKTNIFPETIYNMHKSGESVKFIAFTYDLNEKEVADALDYCQAA